MSDHFPLGSEMLVYYNPDNPKLGYVERYAPNYMWIIFLISGLLPILILGIVWFFE